MTILASINGIYAGNESAPEYLYKVVSIEQWQDSLQRDQVVITSIDKDFIHLSKEDQVAHVVQKYWNEKNYVILKLASQQLIGRLVYETNPGGTAKYYHLYNGKIPLAAVKDVTDVQTRRGHPLDSSR